MSNTDLYVQVDGESENPEGAIADAAVSESNIPFREGQIVEVKIEAAWLDLDGKYHARVSLIRKMTPEKEMIKVPHDKITKSHNDNDDTLENDPKLQKAEDDFEHDFEDASDEEAELKRSIEKSYDRQRTPKAKQPGHDTTGAPKPGLGSNEEKF